jgi:sterol desaturase/sphingolipid hydroxylase (fatty acid hydroxylase superfamily)
MTLELTIEIIVVWLISLAGNWLAYVVSTAVLVRSYRYFWDKGLAAYKIQEREASQADIDRERKSSLRAVWIFSVIYAAVYFGAEYGVFTIYLGIDPLGWGYFVFSIVAILIAHDAYFYWTHRALHLRRFARFHRTHHQSITPTAYACYAFDTPEAIIQGLFLPLWLLIAPMQLPALIISFSYMMIRNMLGHSGVELFPRGPGRSKWFGWLVTHTDHDLHHSTFRHNYGFHFTFWDRLMGTEHPLTREQRLSSGGETPATLSAKDTLDEGVETA